MAGELELFTSSGVQVIYGSSYYLYKQVHKKNLEFSTRVKSTGVVHDSVETGSLLLTRMSNPGQTRI